MINKNKMVEKKIINVDRCELIEFFFKIINIFVFISMVIQQFLKGFKLFPQSLLFPV